MSYYDPQTPASWQQSQRQGWDPRSAATTPTHVPYSKEMGPAQDLTTRFTAQMKPEDPSAFGSQLDEVDRAVDNLVKSGKMFNPPRRDSMPMIPGAVPRFPVDTHERVMATMPVRHYSVPEFEAIRSPSAANLQNFYATQRFQPPRTVAQPAPAAEPESLLQAKRRAAAQRERELRNYHQEQQFHRSLSSNSPLVNRDPAYKGPLAVLADLSSLGRDLGRDRVVSPGAMSEEDRRELIARQHRALYNAHSEGAHSEDGNNPNSHLDDVASRQLNLNANGVSAPASNAGGTRGPSPMSIFDPFGLQQNGQNSNIDAHSVHTPATEQPPSGAQTAGAASPNHARASSGSPSVSGSFSLYDRTGVQGFSNRTTASSPGGSPPRSQRGSVAPPSSVAPIGTRPTSQAQNQALKNAQRATTPLASPLSYGFGPSETDPFNNLPKERSSSAASTEQHSSNAQGSSDGLGWSKVWGPGNKGLSNVASVWG
ncbi:hypothetical protein FN846DRAFT_886305 [Sphaerosporella brunnea]|uniref:Uncharacterized protein n=1 Tax=Sphaerosporella brunnea TaxID=1250544 RepID=A0A5J5F964_9PEZI|nr:hypothetical protein FN846DRAFT_886305 [Sphaerosporella brunnea]